MLQHQHRQDGNKLLRSSVHCSWGWALPGLLPWQTPRQDSLIKRRSCRAISHVTWLLMLL